MAHAPEVRRDARRRYVHDRQQLPMVALALGVPEVTVKRWKREARADGDDWDAARAAATIAGEGLDKLVMGVVEDYVALHQQTIEDLKTAPEMPAAQKAQILAALADSFNKTVSAAGRVAPKISELGVAMDVLKRLADFIVRFHPDRAEALLSVIEPFGERLAEVYR